MLGSLCTDSRRARCVSLYRRGKLAVDKLMSARSLLEEINLVFDRLASGRTLRQIVML